MTVDIGSFMLRYQLLIITLTHIHVKVCIVSGRFSVLKDIEKLMSNGCSDTPVRTSTTEIVTWSRPRLSHGHEQ